MKLKRNNFQSQEPAIQPITPSKPQPSKLSEQELDSLVGGLSWGGWSNTSYTYRFW
ncbi:MULTISPECIES: hypothetical protein [Moorena]|uniref:Uncharacterized protein n=1 Tax=Moorena producens 3L TaxID=489825 RepID=F4XTP9_9CYAN|nr:MULTISPECIES: hypothetical protein [Moorena]NEQ06455.1 hypothetical protein [Moorena sp. SIO4E2]NEQ14395.1 hypothetical protein [Moorena sp. SIO3E2]NER89224.1 hypothetical protein [Moorena sp. SIO3A2]NES84990.1 hypothetical protein [Moorena sp. SIO2B7]EGJ31875.1 hypothetical protein LYNGBM3L_30890 [Moorena producens 3L]